jgi:hypothetical protein
MVPSNANIFSKIFRSILSKPYLNRSVNHLRQFILQTLSRSNFQAVFLVLQQIAELCFLRKLLIKKAFADSNIFKEKKYRSNKLFSLN